MAVERFPVEAGHIMMFARSIGDPNPVYADADSDAARALGGVIAPLVTWLASSESAGVTGQIFLVGGGRIAVAQPWQRGPGVDHGARWDPAELGAVIPDLVAASNESSEKG